MSVVDTRSLTARRLPVVGGPSPASPSAPLDAPSAPAFGPRGTLIVAGVDGFLGLVDARTGRVMGRLRGHRDLVLAPSASADGRVVVTAGQDGTARLWDTRTRRALGAPFAFSAPDGAAAVSPDGVARGDLRGGAGARGARRALAAAARAPARRRQHGRLRRASRATGACCSPEAPTAASASSRRATGDRPGPAFLAHTGWITSVDASPDGRTLVTAGQDGQVRLWDRATRRPIGEPLPGRRGRQRRRALRAGRRSHVLAVFADGSGYRWDVRPAAWKRQACAVAGRRAHAQPNGAPRCPIARTRRPAESEL